MNPLEKVLRDALAGHSLDNDSTADTLSTILLTYFQHHEDCPKEDCNGWRPWAVERRDRMLVQLGQVATDVRTEEEYNATLRGIMRELIPCAVEIVPDDSGKEPT